MYLFNNILVFLLVLASFNHAYRSIPISSNMNDSHPEKSLEEEEGQEVTTSTSDKPPPLSNGLKSSNSSSLSPSSPFSLPSSSAPLPFSVNIGGRNYYGGLVTYTHSLHPARICRILNGCIRPHDGTLVLPSWLQRHDDIITFHCGYTKVEFTLPDKRSPPVMKKYFQYDLIQILPLLMSATMPKFLSQFITSTAIFDLFYGVHEQIYKTCHSRLGSNCNLLHSDLINKLYSSVVLSDRLKYIKEKKSWPKQFINLMKPPGRMDKQPRLFYYNDLLDENRDLICFRSILFTRNPFNKNLIMKDHLSNIHFFTLNGIQKDARLLFSSNNKDKDLPNCHLNITVTNRISNDNDRMITPRYIPNINRIKDEIIKQSLKIPKLSLTVSTLILEGKTLRWHMNAMQKTDILISGHGPLLSNILFLRENSTLIEIQPFTYYSQLYEKMAERLAHINYERYIAHPDYQTFHSCISKYFPIDHKYRSHALSILRKFALAVEKYKQSDSTHTLVLQNDDNDEENINVEQENESEGDQNKKKVKDEFLKANRYIAKCAKIQRLDTDARKLAIAIVRQARLTCNLPHPTTSITTTL